MPASAGAGLPAPLLHQPDQVRLAGDLALELRIGIAHALLLVGVAAAEDRLLEPGGDLHGSGVALRALAGVEALQEVESVHHGQAVFVLPGIGDAQVPLPAGVGRPQDPAVLMDDVYQELHWQAPQLQNLQLHALGHDHQDMAGVDGVVLHALQDYKTIFIPVPMQPLPAAVPLVRVVVGDQHPLEALFLQAGDEFRYGHLPVQGALLCVAMHIEFH